MSENTLCRLLYRDIEFDKTRSKIQLNKKLELLKIVKSSKSKKFIDIRKSACNKLSNLLWFYRLKGKHYSKSYIDKNHLYIERFHHKDLDGIKNVGGTKIIDFKGNPETKNKLDFIFENFQLFHRYLPIIVEWYDTDKFEILTGHHRTICYIRKGYSKIPVYIVKRGDIYTDISSSIAKILQRFLCYTRPIYIPVINFLKKNYE